MPLAWIEAAPNPFQAAVQLSMVLPSFEKVVVNVFDIHGRHVRTLIEGSLGPGATSMTWDGRDDLGREAAPGAYFIQAETEGDRVETRVIKLK
jgi:flagellar hook assembly protein FlgD